MQKVVFFSLLLVCAFFTACQSEYKAKETRTPEEMPAKNASGKLSSVHDFTVETIDGKSQSLADYAGKKLLIVNVASECGFTSQYEDLQSVYEQMAGELVVLGFPSNDFGGQESGTNEEIKQFCSTKFDVSFPMFSKISVSGTDQHPLYEWLSTKSQNGWNGDPPKWNFTKYLVDEEGQLIGYYPSTANPVEIMNQINQDEID